MNGEGAPRVPNTTNIHFDYIEGEAMVIALDLKGLAVSTGAACSSGAIEPSHVLTAMGLPPEHSAAPASASAWANKTRPRMSNSRWPSSRRPWRACASCRRFTIGQHASS